MIARHYPPPRTVFALTLTLGLPSTYLYAKYAPGESNVLIGLVSLNAIALAIGWIISIRGQSGDNESFGWIVFDILTDRGRLPSRLLAVALAVVLIIAIVGEITDVQARAGSNLEDQPLAVRFVENDLYWSTTNFFNASAGDSIEPGIAKATAIAAQGAGLIFFGMFVSVLVAKSEGRWELISRGADRKALTEFTYGKPTGGLGGHDRAVNNDSNHNNKSVHRWLVLIVLTGLAATWFGWHLKREHT